MLSLCVEFQNYLRTQAGNTTTVNIIICTVDYLLRVQVIDEYSYRAYLILMWSELILKIIFDEWGLQELSFFLCDNVLSYVYHQESIMDFYWHYSSKDTIDPAGKDSFCRAITVAAQVFCSISEYIQVNGLYSYF